MSARRIGPLAHAFADRLRKHEIDAVCGPLVEGAFVAMIVARRLEVPFPYAERFDSQRANNIPLEPSDRFRMRSGDRKNALCAHAESQ